MRERALHRCIVLYLFIAVFAVPSFVWAESYSIEVPFPQLADLVSQKKLSASDLVEILVEGTTELGDLPPDFSPRAVNDPDFVSMLGKAIEKKVSEILITQSSAKTIGLKKLTEVLLPENNAERKKIHELISLCERIEHFEGVEDAVHLVGLRHDVRDTLEETLLEERISRLLLKLAKKNIEAKHGESAIKLLAQIDSRWEPSDSLGLVLTAFGLYHRELERDGSVWILDDPANDKFLSESLERDPKLRAVVAEIFSVRTLQLVVAGDADGAAKAFDRVIKERPDPSALNDELRLNIISSARLPAVEGFARGRAMDLELSGGLGILTKCKLLLDGYYGSIFPIAMFGCLSLVIFFAVVSRFKPDFVLTVPRISLALPKTPFRKKRAVSGYKQPAVSADEYTRLLAQFELDDSATEDDIRKAYRQKMKDLHPDAAAESENTEDFINLKQAYERILEIQRNRFFKS